MDILQKSCEFMHSLSIVKVGTINKVQFFGNFLLKTRQILMFLVDILLDFKYLNYSGMCFHSHISLLLTSLYIQLGYQKWLETT